MGRKSVPGYEFKCILNQFNGCFQDIGIFERSEADNRYFESGDITRENTKWLVVAAGLNQSQAVKLFKGSPKRVEKAVIPLRYRDTCELKILFELRACDNTVEASWPIAPFAAKSDVPWVEIRNAFLGVVNLPENQQSISNLRWEWDVYSSLKKPTEKWLRKWHAECGFNPAHPLPHLHINSAYLDSAQNVPQRPVKTIDELRLAIGYPNPLALLLSLGTWLRKLR